MPRGGHLRLVRYRSLISVCLIVAVLAAPVPSAAHETDQYALPLGRQLADVGQHMTAYFVEVLERAVEKCNRRIDGELQRGRDGSRYHSQQAIADAVNREFPPALFLIERLDRQMTSLAMKDRWPGDLPGYKPPPSMQKYLMYPVNPFRAWTCATLKIHGIYVGTDKIGHFTDMGMHYYREYAARLRRGDSEEEAIRRALAIGRNDPIRGESKLLGHWTSGAYSNADMASNYLGMLFYRNLTEPQRLKGEMRPPMLERDGPYWKLAPHVRRDSDWFSYFISPHLDEAMNPSFYLPPMRKSMRKLARDNATSVLEMRLDRYGNRRPEAYFRALSGELKTYWGADYGHRGSDNELVQVADHCFPSFDDLKNADPHARDRLGRTPLHVAAERGDTHAIRRLLVRGADIRAQVRSDETASSDWGNTPLHAAALSGHSAAVRLLLERGADPNARNDRGATPLHLAVEHSHIVAMLLDGGADRDVRDGQRRTILHYAAIGAADQTLALVLDRGADADARDNLGRTALYLAAECNDAVGVAKLAGGGADPGIGDSLGLTPLHLATRYTRQDVLRALIAAGAPLNARDQLGCTPLHEAARHRSDTVVAMLLAAGAEPSAADAFGTTALHLASRAGDEACARVLVRHGADAHVRSASRGTPIDEARRAGHVALVALFEEADVRAVVSSSEGQ